MACWSCSGAASISRWPASARTASGGRAIAASLAFHLLAAAPLVVGVPTPAREPAAPRWAQVELIQQETPTVGAAAGAADVAPATPLPSPAPPPAAAQPLPSALGGTVAAVADAPAALAPESPQPAVLPGGQSAEAPAVRLGDVATGTGLVSGSAVIPAGLDTTVHNRLPAYPAEAARRGEEGVVILLVQIAPDGHATAIDVQRSSGYERLDRTARAAVSGWQFRPAVRDGLSIASMMEVEVHFDIRWTPR